MSEPNTKMNPLIATAAVAVIIFSAVGVGVMTGIIPSSKSANDALTPAETKMTPAPEVKAAAAPVHKPAAQVAHKRTPSAEPRQQLAMNESAAAPVQRTCFECGVIDTINVVDKKGEGSGVGAVGGAVVGGLVGNQIGNGRGNTVATVAGALGGAFAGNEVEKRVKSVKEYQITVRMNDGNTRTFAFDSAPGYVVGDKVKVVDSRLVRG
jgi:outer membrane lipoprotein SlyB